jgi:hypothetical protein
LAAAAKLFGGPLKKSGIKCTRGGFIRCNQFIPAEVAGLKAVDFAEHNRQMVDIALIALGNSGQRVGAHC